MEEQQIQQSEAKARTMVGEQVLVEKTVAGPQGGEHRAGPFAAVITGVRADDDGDIQALHATVFLVGSTVHVELVNEPKLGEWSLA